MRIVTLDQNNELYPQRLKNIFDAPQNLYCLGNLELLKEKKIMAVIGSRELSGYGRKMIETLVPGMVAKNITIVSGMAFGVDAWAQHICLKTGGKTIAVLASGCDVISPLGNKWLYDLILKDGGLIVSERVPGSAPDKGAFLKRNRIVAGLSSAVVVIEGGENSGSVHTARLALDMGRDVGAVPGRVGDENSKASHYLIKNGARMVENVDDVEALL